MIKEKKTAQEKWLVTSDYKKKIRRTKQISCLCSCTENILTYLTFVREAHGLLHKNASDFYIS